MIQLSDIHLQLLVYHVLCKLFPPESGTYQVMPLEKRCFEDLKLYLAKNSDCVRYGSIYAFPYIIVLIDFLFQDFLTVDILLQFFQFYCIEYWKKTFLNLSSVNLFRHNFSICAHFSPCVGLLMCSYAGCVWPTWKPLDIRLMFINLVFFFFSLRASMEGYLDAYNPNLSITPAGIFVNRVEVRDA